MKLLPKEERPVEKIISDGVSTLSNSELIAIILGSGTRDVSAIGLAQQVISKAENGIGALVEMSAQELMMFSGIGPCKAARLLAAVELGKRISVRPERKKICVDCSETVAKLFMEDLRYSKREIFKALLLNAKGEILSVETVSVGELTSTLVHPREVFLQAIKKSAAAIVFVHNHPSGDPTPSKEDLETTKMLVECGNLLRIKVVDHIIIGDGIFQSIKNLGYI